MTLAQIRGLSAEYILSKVKGQLWSHILVYDSLISTNDLATGLLIKGEIGLGYIILADRQEKGKGRQGRRWISPPGVNIYLSAVLQPDIATEFASFITIMAAVSCAFAIRKIAEIDVKIKWPNDLIVADKKFGGILTEVRIDNKKLRYAVVGIGINVNMEKDMFPAELQTIATSLKVVTGRYYSREEIIVAILQEIERVYDLIRFREGRRNLLNRLKQISSTIGKTVKVVTGKEVLSGIAEDINDQGFLVLKLPTGVYVNISAGDITNLR